MNFIQLWCEYDFGQDNKIFESEETAAQWLDKQILDIEGEEFAREQGLSFAELDEDGLVGFNLVELIKD